MMKLPKQAGEMLAALNAAGGRGYVVGGGVYRLLCGSLPTQWAFCAAPPLFDLLALPGARLAADGTHVMAPMGGDWCRVYSYAPPTGEAEGVALPGILGWLARQDFTVDAMACDGEVLLDPFGGQQDARRKTLRCVGAPKERFAASPLRALRMFRRAAELGFTAEWDTYAAAADVMGELAFLPRQQVARQVRAILMSDGPQVLGGVIAKGGLSAFGFHFAPDLTILKDVPRTALCRWWALTSLCGAGVETVSDAFGFAAGFRQNLAEVSRLYALGPARDNTSLKQKLATTRVDYTPIAATFAALTPAYAAEPPILALVMVNREPYRVDQLAVTEDALRYEGIGEKQRGQIMRELLEVVIKNPSLNQPPVLLGLARGLKKLL